MTFPFRLASLVLFLVFVSACQPRIQPIYVPSSVALPSGLETAPLSDIRDGILDAGAAKGWRMKELEPGVIRGTLDVQNKHQAVVDVVYTNQSFAIKYVSSRNLLSQDGNIHRSYNAWVRRLETNISSNLSYLSSQQLAAKKAPAISPKTGTTAFDPAGLWNVSATYTPTAVSPAFCPTKSHWTFRLDFRKRGGISHTYWSDSVQLQVTGEHSEEHMELVFSVPDGGSDWQLTQRLKLDKPQVRLTSKPKSSASSTNSISSCIGVIDIVMKKLNSRPTAQAVPTPTPSTAVAPAPVSPAPKSPPPKAANTPPPVVPTATAADIAWRNLEDKQDPAALRQFLKEHLDSNYASVAILNLNEAMARSSEGVATGPKPTGYDTTGTWRVTTAYTGDAANTSSCPKNPKWTFTITLPDKNLSKSLWSDSEQLTINNEGFDGKVQLKIVFPRGGSDWQWANRFILDQDRKTFLSESNGFGGTYGTCTGKLVFLMQKVG